MFSILLCPVGSKCPSGSTSHIVCNDPIASGGEGPGYYQPNEAQAECLVCPAGFYCDGGGTVAKPCPPGHYCNEKTSTPSKCPIGTYMPFEGTRFASECLECEEGYECQQPGIEGVELKMRECGSATGGGFYCPAGASSPIECAEG